MNTYSVVRQPTGSFRLVHSQAEEPARPRASRQRARLVDVHPQQRARPRPLEPAEQPRPGQAAASSGRPTTVTDSPTPGHSTNTT